MARTPDRRAGPLYEEGIYLENVAQQPSVAGEIRRNGDDLFAKDSVGVFNLRQGGAALPFEYPFTARLALVIHHNRGVRPLVQVIIPEVTGWNIGGWGVNGWNGRGGQYVRLPDDQYVTTHVNENQFIVRFAEKLSGKVVYF